MRDADYRAICQGGEAWRDHVAEQTERDAAWKADLSRASLRGSDLSGALLSEARLQGADLAGASLHGANLIGARLADADLSNSKLAYSSLHGADLTRAHLARADLTRADLTEADLTRADLTRANLTRADLTEADLTRADLSEALLTRAVMTRADLTEAVLTNTIMTRANLSEAIMIGGILIGADAHRANLTDSNLTRANLHRADLTGANLGNSNLTGANFSGTNMTAVDLWQANLTRIDLTAATLDASELAGTYFIDMDLADMCDAKEVKHYGPSIVDVRTLVRSASHPRFVPFMAACGIPETLARYMVQYSRAENQGDLLKRMYSTFISYGGPDEEFARKLYEALKPTVAVFFFPENAPWGGRVGETVYREVQRHERILLICSKDSLTRPGQRQEIVEALDREDAAGGATYLLPVRLDDYLFDEDGWIRDEPELAKRLRRRVVGDFRRARDNQHEFDQAVDRLLQELMKDRPGRQD